MIQTMGTLGILKTGGYGTNCQTSKLWENSSGGTGLYNKTVGHLDATDEAEVAVKETVDSPSIFR